MTLCGHHRNIVVPALMTLFDFLEYQRGLPKVMVAVFFFGGVQLLFLGVIGEYIIAICNQIRRRLDRV